MAQHRAHRASTRAHSAQPAVPSVGGKRKAVKTKAPRIAKAPSANGSMGGSLLRVLPSAPIIAGVATLAVSAGGAAATNAFGDEIAPTSAVAAGSNGAAISGATAAASSPTPSVEAGGTDAGLLQEREAAVSRDSRRTALAEEAAQEQALNAQAQAAQHQQALKNLGGQVERQAEKIEANLWVLPVHGYRITATFGMSSGLWSRSHTGLDFAAPSGTPIMAVANGVVTETGYDGAYGNKTVLTLEDGTDIWFCHQTTINVTVGQTVRGGEVIGSVGSTGNSTGPHLHLEVRPSPDTPIDPWGVLLDHGLQP